MIHLKIDNQPVSVAEGSTILQAAEKLGITIPTLCHLRGQPAVTSCMVCVVKVHGRSSLLPACGALAENGMVVDSNTDEVRAARRTALELLLSDHVGDCVGPCQVACPAGMNIPRMIREIREGHFAEAATTVRREIALPAVVGRICPAPCEKACRRGQLDSPVSICLLKRFVSDASLAGVAPATPRREIASGKTVAIVGAGPAGLAAAYYLLQFGHACTVFDNQDAPGGRLRDSIPPDRLPPGVLDAEIELIARLGADFRQGRGVGRDVSLDELVRDFSAVLIACGKLDEAKAAQLGLPWGHKGLEVDRHTLATPRAGVFAAGCAIRPNNKLAIRSLADGKHAAGSIEHYLRTGSVPPSVHPFNCHMGHLQEGEAEAFLAGVGGTALPGCAATGSKACATDLAAAGLTAEEARSEAARCLHCDCRKADGCKLRNLCGEYQAHPSRYAGPRRNFHREADHPEVFYESGKCIDCGLCVRLAAECKESLGLCFIGRGFNVRVAVPFGRPLTEGLRNAAARCAAACPTGALSLGNR